MYLDFYQNVLDFVEVETCVTDSEKLCQLEFDVDAILLAVPLLGVAYLFDGKELTRFRNLIMIGVIYFYVFLLVVNWHVTFIIALLSLLAAFDGGKNTGMALNKHKWSEFGSISKEIFPRTEQSKNEPKSNVNFNISTLDGILGGIIIITSGIIMSIHYELVPVDLWDIILPTFEFLDIEINPNDVAIALSFVLISVKSSFILSDRIFRNRVVLKIPIYGWLVTKLSFLYRIYSALFACAMIILFLIAFFAFVAIAEFQLLMQSMIITVWGIGYFLNS